MLYVIHMRFFKRLSHRKAISVAQRLSINGHKGMPPLANCSCAISRLSHVFRAVTSNGVSYICDGRARVEDHGPSFRRQQRQCLDTRSSTLERHCIPPRSFYAISAGIWLSKVFVAGPSSHLWTMTPTKEPELLI